MSSLEDDIARIAALRGRPAPNYQADAQRQARHLPSGYAARLFSGNPNPRDDLAFFDRLPQRSRDFIRECWWPLNAGWWAEILIGGVPEDVICDAVLAQLPDRRHDWIMRHYGPTHPSTRRLA